MINEHKQYLKEEIQAPKISQNKEITSLIDKSKFKAYKQNMIIDNTIKELVNFKQIDILGNATSKQETKKEKFELVIEEYVDLQEVLSKALYNEGRANQSAGKLLDCLLIKLTEEGFQDGVVKLPLREYAKQINKTDLKELRKRTKIDLQILKKVKITNISKRKSKTNNEDFMNIYLFGGTEVIKNGNIYIRLNPDFFNIFASQKNFLYMPLEALQSNERTNPHTYLLYKRIISHKRINEGKPRANTIKVKELYEYCTTLPRYENIREKRRTDKPKNYRAF